jgi:hypothetical protein
MKYTTNSRGRHVQLMLSEQVLAQWWHPVASSEALDLLHQAMCMVTYHHIVMAIKTAYKVGVMFDCCVVDCHPGGRRSGTEQVFDRWQRPVASIKALDLLHRAMPCALLKHVSLALAIKMTCNGGAFVCHHQLFCLTNHSQIT